MTKILWCLPPLINKNSGVYIYNEQLILLLGKDVEINLLHLLSTKLRYFHQFFILPFVLFFCSFKYDKVVIPDESMGWLSLFCFGKAYVVIHDVRPLNLKAGHIQIMKYFYVRVSLYICSKVSKLIFVSHYTKNNFLLSLENQKYYVIPNVIDFKVENNNEPTKKIKKYFSNLRKMDDLVFIYVGSDEVRKNTIALCEAIAMISKTKPIHFVKIGRPINEEVFSICNDMIKESNVLSYYSDNDISSADLFYALQNSTAFIMPSLFEGFGRTPVEAQLFGLPVISTSAGALSEVLGESCYKIEKPYGAMEIYEAVMGYLVDNNKDRIIFKGYSNAERYNQKSVYNKAKFILS